ncbi:hypothetical protein BK143_10965 [Paenibacillus peoriae]|uniref:hypothetical protein n=1 Tax=Paenibacillus TaxID=44249 RepID=UPI00096C82AD|nr:MULTISPECIES: hypothetical protein [Paenibacillus]MXO78754.1 hypothetical protein [Paenibacillus sp. OT2-17]OMF72766.1 hypothetical protein BK143_10965 [Paenibacillus peoriae]
MRESVRKRLSKRPSLAATGVLYTFFRQINLPDNTLKRWFYTDTTLPSNWISKRVGDEDIAREGCIYGICILDLNTRQVLGLCEGRKESDILGFLQRTVPKACVMAASTMSKAIHVLSLYHRIPLHKFDDTAMKNDSLELQRAQ